MGRLTTQYFWGKRHEQDDLIYQVSRNRSNFIHRVVDNLRTSIGAWPGESYSEFIMRRIFTKFLPKKTNQCCLEIGCAPGRFLVLFNRLFGYEPYGVEYSPVGVQKTQKVFVQAGFNPENIFESDVFDVTFQDKNASRYHVVFSRGFIEHFDNPREGLEAHVNLIKPNGYLVCTIPNLLGWSYPHLKIFAKDAIRAHNLSIMHRNTFRNLFDDLSLKEVYCNYSGMFGLFGLSLHKDNTFRNITAKSITLTNDVINHLLFATLRGHAFESPWSPYLVYIGKKKV